MINIFFADNYNYGTSSGKFDIFMEHCDIFEKYDINIVHKLEQCSLIICNYCDIEILNYASKNTHVGIIICERVDAVTLGNSVNHAHLDEVVAIFKEYVFRKPTNTIPMILKRYHYFLLSPKSELITHRLLPITVTNKIHCVPWNFNQYSHVLTKNDMKYACNLYETKKDIDVFCVCHDHEKVSVLNEHRKNFKNIIKQMSTKSYKIYVKPIRNKNEYLRTLARSKIVVAPYGFGERMAFWESGSWSQMRLESSSRERQRSRGMLTERRRCSVALASMTDTGVSMS